MTTAPARSAIKISTKIALVAVCPVILALIATGIVLLVQQNHLGQEADISINEQARSETAKIAQSVYQMCLSTEQRNQADLTRDLGVARRLIQQNGEIILGSEKVVWSAVNQFTQQAASVTLPQMLVGTKWLGQIAEASRPVPIVDDVQQLTGVFCTVFQRMNEAGDMLRIATNVLKTDGTRALGTYIPAKNDGGEPNPVIAAVLRGETYRGRAFVVNDWHAAAYEPVWDAAHQQVIGMLYVGLGLRTINKELCEGIAKLSVGKTGYVFVLAGNGDQRGQYLVSYQGKQNGANIWDAKDATGRHFIQSIIEKGMKQQDGTVDFESYEWQNPGESRPRTKFAAVTAFGPWKWVIGASAYEEDFADIREHIAEARTTMVRWVAVVATVAAAVSLLAGILLSRALSRPITRVISELTHSSAQIAAAAGQVSDSSQLLAEGSNQQASALEETSSSLEEMAGMTRRNAENATRAKDLSAHTRAAADSGSVETAAMNSAMIEIKQSSDGIAKIIKTIDEIAFQTNILALNAAVEAARAGEAGLGFAVVADEVRGLAQRSATAARETAEKIESAIAKTNQGVALSERVAKSLTEIAEKVRQMDAVVAEVANASRDQSDGINQINTAVSSMDRIVQRNAASAEESASAAEELNAQAMVLRESTVDLQLSVGESVTRSETPPAKIESKRSVSGRVAVRNSEQLSAV